MTFHYLLSKSKNAGCLNWKNHYILRSSLQNQKNEYKKIHNMSIRRLHSAIFFNLNQYH